jgi:predicted DCC family thiol-disulfide oxidoreductase YuxK
MQERAGRPIAEAAPQAPTGACYAFSWWFALPDSPEILFYDGHCGLCHRAVKFVLKRDRTGAAFRFAPLQGATFVERLSPAQRANLPDSVIVLTNDGQLLIRSDAFLHMLRRLGGGWRLLAGMFSIVPRVLRDAVYNFIARIRYSSFGHRDDLCPIMPPDLRERFLP